MEQFGPYKIESVLGRGGMGHVYAAVDERTGQRVAVKVLAPAYAGDPHFRARFGTEIQSLKKLRHPGIVELYGYGEQEGHLFYAMELVEGKSLAEQLRAGRRFSWRETVRIGIDICAALRHAHDRGVIHRDLKPANLMLGPEDQVKLTDFGIAKLFGASQLTSDGGVLGTADYMSPEQADGRAATVRSDLYSLGSVLYAMMARRSPFAAATMGEVIHGLMYEDPPPLERLVPEAPDELLQIIHRLLEKDPEKRIGTALAVANRLAELQPVPLTSAGTSPGTAEEPQPRRLASQSTDVPNLETAVRPTVEYARKSNGSAHEAVTKDAPTIGTDDSGEDFQGDDLLMPEAADHFTSVGRGDSTRTEPRHDMRRAIRSNWPMLTLLILLLAGVATLMWFATRPESADELYARIAPAAQTGGSQLAGVESDIDRFLALFPDDPRRSEIAGYKQLLDVQQWQQQMEFRAKLGDRHLSAPVQLLLKAKRLAQTDPQQAVKQLEALIDMLDEPSVAENGGGFDRKEDRMALAAARRQLQLVEVEIELESQRHLRLIRRQLRRADELQSADPATARQIRQGVIELYSDKPWASAEVKQARDALLDGDAQSDDCSASSSDQ